MARKKKAEPVFNWHPNFRVVESLPDIKQVRTGFIVNFVAITLAVLALGWTLYTEVQIHKVGNEIDGFNTQIEGLKPTNTKDLAASTKFVTASKPLQFAAKKFSERLRPLDVMGALLDARPENILLDSVDVSAIIIELGPGKKASTQRIIISGTLTSPSSAPVADFVDKVINSPALKSQIATPGKDVKYEPVKYDPMKHDPLAGTFKFTVTLTLKPSS